MAPETPNDPAPDPDQVDANFTGDDPNCLDVQQQVLYDNYWSAYDAYLDETHFIASHRDQSDSLFALVAAVPDSVGQGYSAKCQQLIHIARSRVDAPPGPEPIIGGGNNSQSLVREDGENWVQLFPNPATDAMTVQLQAGEYSIRVFNQLGMLLYQTTILESTAIEVANWPAGLYFMEVYDRVNRQLLGRKVHIQH